MFNCLTLWTFPVLRDIQQEDTLWQQRHAKESKQQPAEDNKQPAQESQEKEPAPSTAGADKENGNKTQPRRKLNFF